MKKKIAVLLTLLLAAGSSVPAFAAENAQQTPDQKKTVVVSLDSIEGIMKTYNFNLQTYENDLEVARHNKKDNKGDESEAYYNNQLDLAEVQYDENVAKTMVNAKQSYLAYCADDDKYMAAQTNADNAQKAYNAAFSSLSSGFASQKDCDNLKDEYLQAQNTLTQLNSQMIRDRASLRALLNLPDNVNMSVKPISSNDLDFSGIPNINYDTDQIVMLGLDATVKQAAMNYDYLENDVLSPDSHDVENAKIAVEQAKTSEKAAFKKLYDSLNSAYTVYQQDLDKVQRAQQALEAENKAFAAGYSSQQSVNGKTNDLNALQSTLATDRNTLYTCYLNYTNMKKGFSTGS